VLEKFALDVDFRAAVECTPNELPLRPAAADDDGGGFDRVVDRVRQ
jgi:hypothetical protein